MTSFHSLSTAIHSQSTAFFDIIISHLMKSLPGGSFASFPCVEKIKSEKFGREVGKSVILCHTNKKLTQTLDIDRLSRRIRGHFRRKGPLSSTGWVQKTAAGRRESPFRYQQGI
jgi:hypothetical protein